MSPRRNLKVYHHPPHQCGKLLLYLVKSTTTGLVKFTTNKQSLLQATPRMGGGLPVDSPRCILKRTTCDFLVIRSRCGKLSSLISWLYVPVVGNSAHSRYGKSRNCVWSEGAVGNALSRDSRYFVRSAITGIRVAQLLGIPTLGRENFFIRERQLFSETKLNNKSPLQSLLFIIDKKQDFVLSLSSLFGVGNSYPMDVP